MVIRNSLGDEIDKNSTNGFNGYTKKKDLLGRTRIIYKYLNGYLVRQKSWLRTPANVSGEKLEGRQDGWA